MQTLLQLNHLRKLQEQQPQLLEALGQRNLHQFLRLVHQLHQEAGEGVVLLGGQAEGRGVLIRGLHDHQMSKSPNHLHQVHHQQ
jgi:hypothetical protein